MAEHQKGAPPPGTVVFGGPLDEGPERLRPPEDMNENELKMSKKHRYALMRAAGLPPGPYVSITAAVDIFRKRKLREAVVYLIFLLVFNVGAFVQRDVTDSHQYSQSVRAVITSREFPVYPYYKTFANISTQEDFWAYVEEVIPRYLYPDEWYNGEPYGPDERRTILYTNRLVQAPRLRQIRRSLRNCSSIPPRLANFPLECRMGSFFALSGGPEAREPITGWPPGTMLNYSSAAELGQSASQTQLGWYEGGGFVLDFPLSLTAVEVRQIFRHLRVQRWTDLGTRAVFFDFALYNSAQRFFLGVRLNFEFLPTGKIKTSDSFRVMRMGVLAPAEWLALVLDAALYLIVLFYIAQDCKKIWDGEWRYWSNPWHYLNWTMYVLFGVSGAFKVLYWMWSLEYINGEMGRDEESAVLDFETLGWYYSQVWNWTSFNCIFVWFKAFSFFKYFNKRIADLSYAVLTSAPALRDFLLVLLLTTAAFAVSFHVAFGIDIRENRTLLTALFELFELFTKGEVPYDDIVDINTYLGLSLLMVFQIVVAFLLLKLPAAILIRSFSQTRDKGVDDPMSKEFRTVILRALKRALEAVFYRGVKDETQRFREEREREMEATLDAAAAAARAAAEAAAVDRPHTLGENVAAFHAQTAEVRRSLVLLHAGADKLLDAFTRKLPSPEEPEETTSTLLFRPPVQAWSPTRAGRSKPVHIPGTVALEGNKTVVPPDWKTFQTAEGETYFMDTVTGRTQWDPPRVLVATQLSQEEQRRARLEALGLPSGEGGVSLGVEFEA